MILWETKLMNKNRNQKKKLYQMMMDFKLFKKRKNDL